MKQRLLRDVLMGWIDEGVEEGKKFCVAEKEGVFEYHAYIVHACYAHGRISEDQMLEMLRVK